MKVWKSVLLLGGLWLAMPTNAWSQAFDPAEYVRTLYRVDLRRDPRSGEVELWTRNILKGMSPDEVRASFLGSEELFKRYDRSLSQYLAGISLSIYQRPASLEELRFWSNRLIQFGGNRTALCLELIRDAARRPVAPPPPPPPPVVVVARPALPAEPIPLATPNPEIVVQAETAMVMVDVYISELNRYSNTSTVANLLADSRKLKGTLETLRRSAAEGASRRDLRFSLRDANDDWGVMRDRRHALNLAIPELRLPQMNAVNDSIERLGLIIRQGD